MELLLQYLANGLVTGSFYALSALGLTLILGLMRVVNFAHGELYMLGGVWAGGRPPDWAWTSSPAWCWWPW
jgi:branched-subunit amino acid ABC-type transport system permease component